MHERIKKEYVNEPKLRLKDMAITVPLYNKYPFHRGKQIEMTHIYDSRDIYPCKILTQILM